MTYTIGLIGGIGSGKTTVSDHFESLGITVADADAASRTVVKPGTPALIEIADHFGQEILRADGSLDRAKLRSVVFQDQTERRWLEQLTVPLILQECRRILDAAKSPYAILVLSTGTGQSPLIQRLLVVDAPADVQIARTMARDNNSRALVESIIAAQVDRETRNSYADDIILNDGAVADLLAKVEQLHETYLQLTHEAKV